MKIVFVDRDGVINKDRPDYIKSWSEFEFLPGSLEALKMLTRKGYGLIVITNQSVINRKLVTEDELHDIHDRMIRAAADHGGVIEAVYYCPHVPEDGCACRKPEPGLLQQAQAEHNLDPSETAMIGDSFKDVLCARRGGCRTVVLVRTGHGREAEARCREAGIEPDHVAEDLMAAATWLIEHNL